MDHLQTHGATLKHDETSIALMLILREKKLLEGSFFVVVNSSAFLLLMSKTLKDDGTNQNTPWRRGGRRRIRSTIRGHILPFSSAVLKEDWIGSQFQKNRWFGIVWNDRWWHASKDCCDRISQLTITNEGGFYVDEGEGWFVPPWVVCDGEERRSALRGRSRSPLMVSNVPINGEIQ